jgi:8-oxo-dGTP pyrophosphatase MutT (NUDIX family)
MRADPSSKALQPSRLPQGRQQVAAVCYRIGKRGIEFLLVQTRSGRWIFPKGGVEPGLTPAQSAALEALEEAGVHGRMEALPFARYFRRKPEAASDARCAQPELAVAAHLCEVSRLEPPQESNRNPAWFSAERAKQRLMKDRAPEFGGELARVVDRALSRIQRVNGKRNTPDRVRRDGLQEVRFEASPAAIQVAVQAHVRGVYRIGAPEEIGRPVLRLGAGAGSAADTAYNITAIDSGGRASLPKAGNLSLSKHRITRKFVGARTEKS